MNNEEKVNHNAYTHLTVDQNLIQLKFELNKKRKAQINEDKQKEKNTFDFITLNLVTNSEVSFIEQ